MAKRKRKKKVLVDSFWKQELANKQTSELWSLYEKALQKKDWHLMVDDDNDVRELEAAQTYFINKLYQKLILVDQGRALRLYAESCPWIDK